MGRWRSSRTGCRPSTAPRAWSLAYDNYSLLWKQQGAGIDKLPLHHKGEVLAGLTQSAQRTGHTEEAAQYLDKMLTVLADTQYEATAKQWKSDPASAATTNLTCKNCHNAGRLANRAGSAQQLSQLQSKLERATPPPRRECSAKKKKKKKKKSTMLAPRMRGPGLPSHMLSRRSLIGMTVATLLTATVQTQQVDRTAALRAQIDRIFKEHAYVRREFGPARWLPDGTAYAIVEQPKGGSGSEIARYDAATGARTVLVDRRASSLPAGKRRSTSTTTRGRRTASDC